MAQGLIKFSAPPVAAASAISFVQRLWPPERKNPTFVFTRRRLYPILVPPPYVRFQCSLAAVQEEKTIVMERYKESFSSRMAMAGLQPHHRIAIGVSGGPDSMALCILTAAWKTDGANGVGGSNGFVDGLLGIVVDHGLRAESNEEAHVVSRRVSEMGIRCEIACCEWRDGRPKQGHIQEAARKMRYQIFHKVCSQNQISALLIAHHADDQAELFILRLSRNSGVLGLAGMAFASQMFPLNTASCAEVSKDEGILVVRPLLHFFKEDMYKICQAGGNDWVEDPTNQSPLYVRNRIRMSLGNLSSYMFQSELQAVISACRKSRAYVDHICHSLIEQAVTVMDQGYAAIDLEILNQSEVSNLCLSKFLALVLQFISQRNRPVRGSTSKLLMDYVRSFPCKTSFTAAGCYLCPAPGSRGTKALVCCSVECPLPSKPELVHALSDEEQNQYSSELEQIIANRKSYSDHVIPDASDLYFLDISSESVLTEAKRLKIISEATYKAINLLLEHEIEHFRRKSEDNVDYEPKNKVEPIIASPTCQPGKMYYFMNRFLITWKQSKYMAVDAVPEKASCDVDLGGASQRHHCWSCRIDGEMSSDVRPMAESDWLCLANLSKSVSLDSLQQQRVYIACKTEQGLENQKLYSNYLKSSARRALFLLKSIPVAARRSLPVLVDDQGLLMSIPSIGFNCCPCIKVSCIFKPRVPLRGGHISFL